MGQVGPVRAHSLRLAIAEALGVEGEPALLVACTTAPAVTLGGDRDLPAEVDLVACGELQVPVLRLAGEAAAAVHTEGALWLSLLLPDERAAGSGLPARGEGRRGWWSGLLDEAVGEEKPATRAIGVDEVAGCLVLTAYLGFGVEERLSERLLRRPAAAITEGEHRVAPRSSPADLAESMLQVLERRAGLELVPSMPLPAELDAVYDWERKLAAMAEPAAVPAETVA